MSAVEALKDILLYTDDQETLENANYILSRIKEIATAALKESEFTVEIIVPEITEHGNCSLNCPLLKRADFFRAECYNNLMPNHEEKPGPGCPRYKGGKG
jgi:hypothetical protein